MHLHTIHGAVSLPNITIFKITKRSRDGIDSALIKTTTAEPDVGVLVLGTLHTAANRVPGFDARRHSAGQFEKDRFTRLDENIVEIRRRGEVECLNRRQSDRLVGECVISDGGVGRLGFVTPFESTKPRTPR